MVKDESRTKYETNVQQDIRGVRLKMSKVNLTVTL